MTYKLQIMDLKRIRKKHLKRRMKIRVKLKLFKKRMKKRTECSVCSQLWKMRDPPRGLYRTNLQRRSRESRLSNRRKNSRTRKSRSNTVSTNYGKWNAKMELIRSETIILLHTDFECYANTFFTN